MKEYSKEYRKKNRSKLLCYSADYYEQNRERVALKQKEYREKNKEKLSESKKKYAEQNRERVALKQKLYREKNKEVSAEYSMVYRKANRIRLSVYQSYKMKYGSAKGIAEKELIACAIASSFESKRMVNFKERVEYAKSRKILWK